MTTPTQASSSLSPVHRSGPCFRLEAERAVHGGHEKGSLKRGGEQQCD